MPIRSQMSSITGQTEPYIRIYLLLNLEKIAEYEFVHTVASTNIDQSALNLVKMYVIIRSRMSLTLSKTTNVRLPN